jgi:DNA processing protein
MSDYNAPPCLESPEHSIAALQYISGFGCHSYWNLLEAINGIETLFSLPLDYLLPQFPSRARKQFRELYQGREKSDCWQQYLMDVEKLQPLNASLVTHIDARYPSLLSNIHNAPPILYVRGEVNLLSEEQIAFVGSRRPTPGSRDRWRGA